MKDIFIAAQKAVGSIFVPGMLGVFFFSLVLTILVLTGFTIGMSTLVGVLLDDFIFPYASYILGFLGSFMLAWIFFPGIMPIIVNFFDNKIATLIEKQYYPDAKPPNNFPWMSEFVHDLKFSLSAILFNILALPFYLIPVVNVIIFYWLNGYLLGKEFFVMVARRYMPVAEAEKLRRAKSQKVLIGGVLLTLAATIPIINFVAPFWGIALMTHLFHQDYRQPREPELIDITPGS